MILDTVFFLNSALLGVGLAMDAFSVSLANGLQEPKMKAHKMLTISGVFAFFQYAMPMLGWFLVTRTVGFFSSFSRYIPYIALILLVFIGGKMILEGIRNIRLGKSDTEAGGRVSFGTLIIQGIATSIDALSVGFTVSDYTVSAALLAGLIIAVVTFIICLAGIFIGRKFGTALSGKATVLGGVILCLVGIEIFLKGIL